MESELAVGVTLELFSSLRDPKELLHKHYSTVAVAGAD